MVAVVALLHKSDHSYGVSFPDFPGAISGGETESEALQRAREGLSLHIESMHDDGDAMPRIRSIEELRADPEFTEDFRDAIALALIDTELPGRSVRLNISLDEGLLQRIDRKARERGESRSGFLAGAARVALAD